MALPIGFYLESEGVVVILILGVLQTSFLQRQKESVSYKRLPKISSDRNRIRKLLSQDPQ